MIFFRDRQSFLREKNSKAKFHPLRILRLMSVSMPSWEKQLALSNIQYWPTTASTTGVTTTTLYRQSYHVMKNEHNGLKLYLFFCMPSVLVQDGRKSLSLFNTCLPWIMPRLGGQCWFKIRASLSHSPCFLSVKRRAVLRLQRSDWDPCGFTSGWDLSGVGWGQCSSSFSGKLSTTDGSARISN